MAQARKQTQPTQQTSELSTNLKQSSNGKYTISSYDLQLLHFDANDNGNAETVYKLHGEKIKFCPSIGWLYWNETYWKEVSESTIIQIIIEVLQKRCHAAIDAKNESVNKAAFPSKKHVADCLWLFKSYVTINDINEFDNQPDLLNCLNGVVNLRTGSLTPHLPCQLFTYCVPVNYNPQADTSLWDTFIHDALRSERVVHFVQRGIGYSLTGHTREEKLFYPYGPTRAGKGTFCETWLAILPRPIGTEIDFNTFTAKRDGDNQNFDLAGLKPARLVVASESNRYQSLNPAKIKQITGGNLIRCAYKHKNMFEYRPQYKVWLISNHEVNADADDTALWGRVFVIPFPISHLGNEDTTLKERLKQPENLEGVLKWGIDGAMLWYQEGRLTPPNEVIQATNYHRDMQDYIKQWVGECCTLDTDKWASTHDLHSSYKKWCETNSVKPLTINQFVGTIVKRFQCIPTFDRRNGKPVRGYIGIAVYSQQYKEETNVLEGLEELEDIKL